MKLLSAMQRMRRRSTSRPRWDLAFILLVYSVWIFFSLKDSRFGLFEDNWFMSVTMAFGSFIAGATSQGGGAVAFPVMTLGFNIDAHSARDFSLMIQSIGMISASIAIWVHRIQVVWTAVFFGALGGIIGVAIGIQILQPYLDSDVTKVFFVSLWLSFGLALILINRARGHVDRRIDAGGITPTTVGVFFFMGIAGGCISGIVGNGIDILLFAVLVLGFRVCETIATPTSVVVMALNSVVGFVFRDLGGLGTPILETTWDFWWVCVPIVVIGAPLGARFISGQGRAFVVKLLLVLIFLQFVTALFVVPMSANILVFAVATFLGGSVFFFVVAVIGSRCSPSRRKAHKAASESDEPVDMIQ